MPDVRQVLVQLVIETDADDNELNEMLNEANQEVLSSEQHPHDRLVSIQWTELSDDKKLHLKELQSLFESSVQSATGPSIRKGD